MTRRKYAALIVCALFAVFVLSAFSLAIVHFHVHCYHDSCPVCQTIQRTEALLRQFYVGFIALLAAVFARVLAPRFLAGGIFISHPTLVSMKVKLTD
jgi:hypothetical protein